MKLYPPYIEQQIPAFPIVEFPEHNVGYVNIPFSFQLNSLVNKNEIGKIRIELKTMSGQIIKEEDLEEGFAINEAEGHISSFTIAWLINPNLSVTTLSGISRETIMGSQTIFAEQFYKIRIAFIDKSGDVGYYSSTAIAKCLAPVSVSIANLSESKVNNNKKAFVGRYQYGNGIIPYSEKIYNYKFNVYDQNNRLYDTSGEKIHNSNQDNPDTWIMNKILEPEQRYRIQYSITTQNLYTATSPMYIIQDTSWDNSEEWEKIRINTRFDTDTGIAAVTIQNFLQDLQGNYRLMRASKENDYKDWVEVLDIIEPKDSENPIYSSLEFKDYTLKHGITYKYGLQKYNQEEGCSNMKISEPITAIFEDIFLYDGERQLKVLYNPKISSFKTTILETKSDTIGGMYPTFYRNGNVYYKEFPISGLISIHADEILEFFGEKKLKALLFPENESVAPNPHTTNLIYSINTNLDAQTVALEREFKLEVLDWLNNGKPKLFKSPTEGNYLIRLMNVSLSPNDTLGRMIHSFSSTAYEVGASDWNSLVEKGIVKLETKEFSKG